MVEWLTRTSTSPSIRSPSPSSCHARLWPLSPLEATNALKRCMPAYSRKPRADSDLVRPSRPPCRETHGLCSGNRRISRRFAAPEISCARTLQQGQLADGAVPLNSMLAARPWGYCGRIPASRRITGLIIHEYMRLLDSILLYKTAMAVVLVHHAVRQLGNYRFNHRIIALQHRKGLVNRRPPPYIPDWRGATCVNWPAGPA